MTGNFESRAVSIWYTDVFEEIVVFSDQEYEKICMDAQGADLTVLMNIPASTDKYEQITEKIYSYAKEHSQINFFDSEDGNLIYERRPCMIKNRQNKVFRLCTAIMNFLTLLVCILMILVEAVESESRRREWKFQHLLQLGIMEKKQKRNFYQELLLNVKLGLLGGIPSGFLLLAARTVHKKMSEKWTMLYLLEGMGISLLLMVGLLIIMKCISHRKYSKLKGRDEK